MNCPRCDSKLEMVSEYYDFKESCLLRDCLCTNCNSVEIKKFYSDGSYKSEWISLK